MQRIIMATNSFRRRTILSTALLGLAGANIATSAEPSGDEQVRIKFVGDIMLDNGPGHAIVSGEDPFVHCAELLLDSDLTIGNLECVVGKGGKQVLKPYVFRAAKGSEQLIGKYFSAVSLANNHIKDFGEEGLVEAVRVLDKAKVLHFGAGKNETDARRPLIFERNGLRIALLGYNGFNRDYYAATETSPGTGSLDVEKMTADIRQAKKRDRADIVIPFLHWGEEMYAEPTPEQRTQARALVDAGASAVIGGHPHVTQTIDIYRGVPIIYSLGNFVFDYYPVDPPEWTGWIVELTFRKSGPADLLVTAVTLDRAGIPRPISHE